MDQVTGTTGAKGGDFGGADASEAGSSAGSDAGTGPGSFPKTARGALTCLVPALALIGMALSLVMEANRRYAPERYLPDAVARVADALANGASYAFFDLDLDFRKLRAEQLKRLGRKPDLAVLGGSQWQEAGASLLPDRSYLNAYVPLDYYDDMLGMVELLVRHDKLPKDLVIAVRDGFFTPAAARADFQWLSGIPYSQAMAERLSLTPLAFWETYPLQRPSELLSPAMLYANAIRWHAATEHPSPTTRKRHTTLDVLHADGSITWSDAHLALLTPERARRLAMAHADAARTRPPVIDPQGVEALDRLLAYLGVRNVRVHLAHPPFNSVFFERVQGSPYMEGLRQVEAVTRELADKHKLRLVGSFDPHVVGCTADMFADAEHASAGCLGKLLADVAGADASIAATRGPAVAGRTFNSLRVEVVELPSR